MHRKQATITPTADVVDDEQLADEDLGERLSAAADRAGPHVARGEPVEEEDVAGDDDDEEPEDLEELVARQNARRRRVA